MDPIVWLIFGVNLTFLYDMIINPEGWTNAYLLKMFGGVNLVSAIIAILALPKKEWEVIKLAFSYFMGLLLSILIIEVAVLSTFGSTFGASTILMGSFTITVEFVLLTIVIFTYIKQRS